MTRLLAFLLLLATVPATLTVSAQEQPWAIVGLLAIALTCSQVIRSESF